MRTVKQTKCAAAALLGGIGGECPANHFILLSRTVEACLRSCAKERSHREQQPEGEMNEGIHGTKHILLLLPTVFLGWWRRGGSIVVVRVKVQVAVDGPVCKLNEKNKSAIVGIDLFE